MIADLVDTNIDVRLITKNVMSVYSTTLEYTDKFIRLLKHSSYLVDCNIVKSDDIIAYINRDYNPYRFVYQYVKSCNSVNIDKLCSYLSFIGLDHLLWMKFHQIDDRHRLLLENLIVLSSEKPIMVIGYIDSFEDRNKLYSLIFEIGLDDKLVIIPFKDIREAVNNSTCQCYVKNDNFVRIQQRFSNEFLNVEFSSNVNYYNSIVPCVYHSNTIQLAPSSMRYSLYDVLLIILYRLRLLFIYFYIRGAPSCL